MMRFASAVICFCAFVFLAGAAAADTIVLKSGDRVTGTITGADNKVVTVKTDFAGEIKVNWSSVAEITSAAQLYVVTPDKRTVSGPITIEGTDLVVHTANSGDVRVALDQLSVLRSPDAQAAYEKSLHPPLSADWKGGANAGLALARGNAETTNLNFGANANRKTLNDQITANSSMVYAKNDAAGGGVTANEVLAEGRYDRNLLDDTIFWFVDGNFTHNALQGLALQSIYTGGLGWHAIHRPKTTFDVLAGLNYTRQTYGAVAGSTTPTPSVQRNLIGATIGENYKHQFGAATTISEDFTFYPDLSDAGQYNFALDSAVNTKISKSFGWQVTFSDRYVSNPPIANTKSNDVIFATGLTVSFGQ
jgi:putative salt-induced outer membrane protein YdiY